MFAVSGGYDKLVSNDFLYVKKYPSIYLYHDLD